MLGFNALLSSLLLQAFGTECLLKALWLVRGNKLASAGKYVPVRGVGQHDLDGIAQLLDVKCTAEERATLRRLTAFGELGRYPIAKSAANERPESGIKLGWRERTERGLDGDWSDADWKRARNVVKRISALVYAEHRRRPPE